MERLAAEHMSIKASITYNLVTPKKNSDDNDTEKIVFEIRPATLQLENIPTGCERP